MNKKELRSNRNEIKLAIVLAFVTICRKNTTKRLIQEVRDKRHYRLRHGC